MTVVMLRYILCITTLMRIFIMNWCKWGVTLIVLLSNFSFISVNICFTYVCPSILGAYMLMGIISSFCIDSYIIISWSSLSSVSNFVLKSIFSDDDAHIPCHFHLFEISFSTPSLSFCMCFSSEVSLL